MNSKLHLTFTALMASSALAFGVFAASPAMLAATDNGPASSGHGFAAPGKAERAIASRVEAVALQIDPRADGAAVEKSRYASGKSRRIRRSMAMPFFSFAPRG